MSLPLWERGLKYLLVFLLIRLWIRSLPLWERGLKSSPSLFFTSLMEVAPLVGAWIEIGSMTGIAWLKQRRSPCGSVD